MESNNNSQNNNKSTINFKIILVGDTGVGKTCLIKNAAKDIFDEIHTPTLGFDMLTFECTIDKNPIKLEIWDTCGQEAYKSLISSFYKDSALAMMVYSIDSNDSFCHIESWLKDIKQQSNPDVKIFLIGTDILPPAPLSTLFALALYFKCSLYNNLAASIKTS